MNNTFLSQVDTTKVQELLDATEQNVMYFDRITTDVVRSYTKDLDVLMDECKVKQLNIDAVDTDYLEQLCLKLSNTLYYMGDKLEQLGIHNDMSKAMRQEIYNKNYLANQVKDGDRKNKTTIAELTAIAEESSKYEQVINNVYERAYKMVKYKIEAGQEMVNSVRKVITRRMSEIDIDKKHTSSIGVF